MKKQLAVKISLYLLAFVLANMLVVWFGSYGLIVTALFLIPFDFVMRCSFHETWSGWELLGKLGGLVLTSSVITYLINIEYLNIALASAFGFLTAQTFASIFYEMFKKKSFLFKVNGSDVIGIIADSIVFQYIAFGAFDFYVFIGQFFLKVVGGLFWYWVIFEKYKLQDKWQK